MPNIYTGIAATSIHPSIGVGIGNPTPHTSSGLFVQEDGTSLFVLESGSGDLALE